jgi:hypothetical protein
VRSVLSPLLSRRHGMARNPCSCCLWMAHCIPNIVYSVLFAFLNLGLMALGVYLVMHAVNCFHSAVAPLICEILGGISWRGFALCALFRHRPHPTYAAKEIYGACASIGGSIAIIGVVGLLGPYVCRVRASGTWAAVRLSASTECVHWLQLLSATLFRLRRKTPLRHTTFSPCWYF